MSSDPCCQNSKLFSIEVSINGAHQCLCLFRGTMANDIGVTTSGFHVFRFDPPCGRCGHRMYVQTPEGIDDHDLLSFAVAQNHHCSLGRDQWCHYQQQSHKRWNSPVSVLVLWNRAHLMRRVPPCMWHSCCRRAKKSCTGTVATITTSRTMIFFVLKLVN